MNIANKIKHYLGNPHLKKVGTTQQLTAEQVEEFVRCSQDPNYFIERYVKIISLDKGFVRIELYPFQKEAITKINDNRKIIVKAGRQVGKCFFINTKIKARDIITNKTYEITVGEFYEYLSRMYEMREKDETIEFSFEEYTQDNNRRIQNTTSRQPDSVRIFDKPIFGKSQERKESGVSAWREVFTILQKLCWEIRPRYTQKGSKVSKTKWQLHNNVGLLDEENGWKRDLSETAVIGKAINIFVKEMRKEIWGRDWERNLVQSTEKMVQKLQKTKLFQNITNSIQRNNGSLFFRDGIFCDMGKRRYGKISKQGISPNSFEWENYSSRFYRHQEKENNRIRRGILALYTTIKSIERTNERSIINRGWISSPTNTRTKFQSKQTAGFRGMPDLSNSIERKFVNSFSIQNWEVLSDTGWVPVTHIHKTVEYKEWVIKTKSGKSLICADDHIVFDSNYNQIFAKNLIPNSSKIITEDGDDLVVDVIETENSSNMYDLTVDSDNHRLYTNGILSHNTTMVVGYILWYIIFNEEKFVAILANKASTAREILSRVKIAYEALPLWLQQGVRTWNKGDIELENNCRVMATSTASSAIRGFSISLLYLDEFAFVPSNIADEFFTSVYPTISSGTTSKILISSTPNGMNHYYKMWTEAVEGINGFITVEANWRQVPGRDQKWADDQKSVLGEQKFLQEMECVAGDTKITVKNKVNNEISDTSIEELFNKINGM